MSNRAVIGLVIVGVMAGAAWYGLARSHTDRAPTNVANAPSAAQAPPLDDARSTNTPDAQADAVATVPSVHTTDAANTDRRALPGATLVGRVVDAGGNAVVGATVSWTVLPAVLDPTPTIEWDVLERSTVWAHSGEAGEFSFPAAPEGASTATSVFWTTRVGFLAEPRVLTADPKTWESRVDVVLQAARGTSARVVDVDGRAVREAHVRQRCVPPDRGRMDRPLSPDEKARVALFRSSDTESDGTTQLAQFPGAQVVHAELGALTSSAWQGELRQPIVLALVPTFTLEGTVTIDGTGDVEGDLHVSISAHVGAEERPLSTHVVAPSKPFGPFAVPLVENARYGFRVDGGRAVPTTEFRDAPGVGETLHVELATSMGNDMWFRLLDDREQVLQSGTVVVHWDRGLLRQSVTGAPRDQFPGYILVRGCPNGRVDVLASAPGFAVSRAGPYTLPPQEQTGYEIVLKKAGRIEGRCVAGGQPVRDFEIALWPTLDSLATQTHQFQGRDDGTFAIDTAPLGEVTLVAASERDGRSDQVRTQVRLDAPTSTVVELAKTMVGRGRVVDEAGNAVSRAVVQLYFNDGGTLLAPFGTPRPVHGDGSFEVRGFQAGQAQLVIAALGYSQRSMGVVVEPGKDVDLGTITLLNVQDLELRLRRSPDVDATTYSVASTAQDGRLARQSFSREGRVVYSAVDAGEHHFDIRRPDGSAQVVRAVLFPGKPWIVEIDVLGTSTLEVELAVAPEGAIPANARLMLQFNDAAGNPNYRYASLHGKDRFTFENVPAAQLFVRLDEGSYKVFGSVTTTLGEGERKVVSLPVGARKTRVRVIDADGNGVAAALVQVYDASGGPFTQGETTDASGACEFQGLPDQPLRVGIVHDVLGNVWGQAFDRPSDPDRVIELEFAPNMAVEVQLVDGDTPVEGVACQLQDSVRGSAVTVATKTDAAGRVRWSKLGPGIYHLFTWHKDYWRADADVTARAEPKAAQVQVRRLGDVRISVRNSTGAPVVHLPVALRSIEFEADVAEWVREERVQANPVTLATDANGTLAVNRLPHGRYAWRISAGSETLDGIVDVRGATVTDVPISIP